LLRKEENLKMSDEKRGGVPLTLDSVKDRVTKYLRTMVSEVTAEFDRLSSPTKSVWTSKRGHLLIFCGDPESKPVLTAENYSKWYELFLVMPDGTVGEVGFGELHELADERGVSPYVDHVPNPSLVSVLAERRGWSIDHVSYEVMVGRWEIEVVHSDG